jgi:2-polyprenyl-3-methyl-5-hydroxy-6-metoxy-1,4-benzoquinol methylase
MRTGDESFREIGICRLCGCDAPESYLDFGQLPLGNDLREDAAEARAAASYPLAVNRCPDCGHFQLAHAVAPELLYATNYTYLSGVGASFVRHFAEYAAWAAKICDLPGGALVVDVGSNDGTCLAAFKKLGFNVCGVDPASMPATLANSAGIDTLNRFFDDIAVEEIVDRFGQADFVTSHNVLAHVDDLAATFRRIHALLKEGGFFAFEVGYFREVLEKGCFDTIYHEHLDYHHAAPLVRHLRSIGFDVIDLSVVAVQGGSLRLLLRKTGKGDLSAGAAAFLDEEGRSILRDPARLQEWSTLIRQRMSRFGEAVKVRAARGLAVVGYGVPTKATLLMRVAGLDATHVAFMVEDNPLKRGRFTPGTGIAILEPEELRRRRPEVILIFAWNFSDDILSRLRMVVDWPIEYVVPLPDLEVGVL